MMFTNPAGRLRRPYPLPVLLMLAVSAGALAIRVWSLYRLPPGLWYDEGINAMNITWMLETGTRPVFFVGNNALEPLYHYLGGLLFVLLGARVFVLRLAAVFIGTITVVLLYRWVVAVLAGDARRRWIALAAATALALCPWHLMMSRMCWRAVLIPAFTVLTGYTFWRAWSSGSLWRHVVAGVTVGIGLYTYPSARLLPFVWIAFLILWSLFSRRPAAGAPASACVKRAWLGLVVAGVTATIVFVPLGIFYRDHPELLLSHSADVSVLGQVAAGGFDLGRHTLKALRILFVSFTPPAPLGWFGNPSVNPVVTVGFVVGVGLLVRRLRRPENLLLLCSLGIMWSPAFLSLPAGHALRSSGLLPAYFTITAVGLVWLADRAASALRRPGIIARLVVLCLLVVVTLGISIQYYFIGWANNPALYEVFDTHLVQLGQQIARQSEDVDVLLPTGTYYHPTMRFGLAGLYHQTDVPPIISPGRQALWVNDPQTPATTYVWLGKDENGRRVRYFGHPLAAQDLTALIPAGLASTYTNPLDGKPLLQVTPIDSVAPVARQLADWGSVRPVDYTWAGQVQLFGFEILPEWVAPGQSPALAVYWRTLVDDPFEGLIVIQLADAAGNSVAQWVQGAPMRHLRWQTGLIEPDTYPLWIGADTAPGTYLVRVAILDVGHEHRVAVFAGGGRPVAGNMVTLGQFHVAPEARPRTPDTSVNAWLDKKVELAGYTVTSSSLERLSLDLFWQTTTSLDADYTVFLQLLNDHNELVTGWDSPPLSGNLPTSIWSPNQMVIDTMSLSVPADLPPGTYRLVTGMYELDTGKRLPASDAGGHPIPDDAITLFETSFPFRD